MARTYIVAGVLVVAACSAPDEAGQVAAGPPVPDLAFTTFDGEETSLAEFDDEPLVVNFWASWCPPCLAEMPDFEEVHQERAGEVTFVGLNTQDAVEAARAVAEQTGVTYLLGFDPDGELFRAFEVASMPSTYLVDRNGHIRHRHAGLMTADQLRGAIDEHLR